MKILITGSSGLIGRALTKELKQQGINIIPFDKKTPLNEANDQDILHKAQLKEATYPCQGIIHLAAISRVIWGEQNPGLCWKTNYEGTLNVLDAACYSPHKPWVIFSSSREVYGNPQSLPVTEQAPTNPINIYGKSKAAAEESILQIRKEGIKTAVVRYSNVYGSIDDHPDRVIPAFCRAAAQGHPLRIDGFLNTFDFVHLEDTVRGTLKIVEHLIAKGSVLPPLHLTTGRETSLKEAADLANKAGDKHSKIIQAPSRTFDVSHFSGNARQTMNILGWAPKIRIEEGIKDLTCLFQKHYQARSQDCVTFKRVQHDYS
jgi:nucleoside-diphosphate-sugar epimerase